MKRAYFSKTLIAGVFALSLVRVSPSVAQSDHTGNGHLISEGDRNILADLSKTAYGRCDVNTLETSSLLRSLKVEAQMKAVLGSLTGFHALMGYRIRREMAGIKWCVTASIQHYETKDEDSISVNYLPEIQVAVRDIEEKTVYIDQSKIRGLGSDSVVMTLIHEVLHSFVIERKHRTSHIRTAVNSIYQHFVDEAKLMKSDETVHSHTLNFNAMLNMTKLDKSFGRVSTGVLFNKYLALVHDKSYAAKIKSRRYVQGLIDYAPNPAMVFDIIANEFGKPGVLWYSPVAYELLNWGPEVESHVLEGLALGNKIKKLASMDNQTFASTWEFTALGACRLGTQYDVKAWHPDETDRSLYIRVFREKQEIASFTFDEDLTRRYRNHLNDFLYDLRRGVCDNPNADGFRYLR